ncbi:MAG: hypothetical protein H6624_06555 [Bdellovibrionaceae bacterium]|nr:hypothetical protein [Bdellovibrionales bacterium]MCB9083985.1 hypothetical protein [Pseudobdellovibrionaceae bacterium]
MFAHKWEPGVLKYLLLYDVSAEGVESEWGIVDYRPFHGYLMNLVLARVEKEGGTDGLSMALSQLSVRRRARGRAQTSVATRLYRVRHQISNEMDRPSQKARELILEVPLK